MNIIADIAGRYEELMLLLDKMPKGEEIILLGDLNDRGPDTDKVIQWAIDNNIRCVKSNHGEMFIQAYEAYKITENDYAHYDFIRNGGRETLLSYGGFQGVPQSHIDYLKNCEWYIETDDLLLSHAPLSENNTFLLNEDFLWRRRQPLRKDKFQIYGHNSEFNEHEDEQGVYGICLDDCFNRKLTGIHWPSKTIYTQEYL